MVLLSATQWSTEFHTEIQKNSSILKLVFDSELYFRVDETDSTRNFLNYALNDEVKASQTGGRGMLTHFAKDLQKLGTNIAGLNKAAQDAIIAQGIEWYYWQGTDYAGKEFFTNAGQSGLLQYTTAHGDKLQGAQDKAKEWVTPWLSPILGRSMDSAQVQQFGNEAQWNVSASRSGATAAARDAGKKQLFIGNTGADRFTGGSEQDMLFGGAGADELTGAEGDDTLVGGIGNDTLEGGTNSDTYIVGEGTDTLTDDAQGEGSVKTKDGFTFTGGRKTNGNTWENGNTQYVQQGASLVIVQNGDAANRTVIENFDFAMAQDDRYLGIALR